jgi:hypothetical protein
MNSKTLLEQVIKKSLPVMIISEELRNKIEIAQNNLNEGLRLEQYLAPSLTTPNFKIAKKWPSTELENTLIKIGAKPYSLGVNPHGYELTTDNDRIRFKSDGTAWSTSLAEFFNYSANSNTNEIKLFKQGSTKQADHLGTLKKVGSKAKFIETPKNIETKKQVAIQKKKEKQASVSALDRLQTVLDWAGIVPYIGDAVDIINAIIYFARGKWFDGFLSVIAIIPYVGSVIKLSIKAIYKGAKLEKLVSLIQASFKTKNTDKVWKDLLLNKAITPSQLKSIGTGLDSLSEVLKTSYSGIRRIPGGYTIIKQLDEFTVWMRNSGRSIDDLTAAAKKAGDALPFKSGIKNAEKTGVSKLMNFADKIPLVKTVTKLRKLPWFPEKKLAQLARGIEIRFMREMQDPLKLTSLIKLAPKSKELRAKIGSEFTTRFAQLPDNIKSNFYKELKSVGITKFDLPTASASQVNAFIRSMSATPNMRGIYDKISQTVVDHSIKNDSIIWNMFKADTMNNLKTLLSKDMIPNGAKLFKELDWTFRKNIDIIWNEIESIGADLGVFSKADKSAAIWPLISAHISGDTKEKVQNWFGLNSTNKEKISAAADFAKKSLGVAPDAGYEPESGFGKGQYK